MIFIQVLLFESALAGGFLNAREIETDFRVYGILHFNNQVDPRLTLKWPFGKQIPGTLLW